MAHYGSHLPGDLMTLLSEGPKPGEEGRGRGREGVVEGKEGRVKREEFEP